MLTYWRGWEWRVILIANLYFSFHVIAAELITIQLILFQTPKSWWPSG